MPANPVARPSSRRSFLTAAAAGTLAGGATFAVKASADADPIFALIEAEEAAWAVYEDAMDGQCEADEAFYAAGINRKPRVQTGTMVTIVRKDGIPMPVSEWVEKPVYAYGRAEVEACFANRAQPVTVTNGDRTVSLHEEPCGELDAALAEFEADKAALENAPERIRKKAAEAATAIAGRAHDDAAEAVFTATPTTRAGLLAMLDLFEKRGHHRDRADYVDDLTTGLLAAVRSILSREA